ncbi:MAG TPA: hypothetical protein VMV02_03280 [Acidimicrobiales bacterium]|nr:hypothetical protein [Acidimicrobiales bacterium]
MSATGGQGPEPGGAAGTGGGSWLWAHAGRLAGIALAVVAFAAMVFLAAIGFRPALFLVVLLVTGVAVIAVGGRIRGS